MTKVYENSKGQEFRRESHTYGYANKFDIERPTREAMDQWLTTNGYRLVGVER